jgi:hypothetical protein
MPDDTIRASTRLSYLPPGLCTGASPRYGMARQTRLLRPSAQLIRCEPVRQRGAEARLPAATAAPASQAELMLWAWETPLDARRRCCRQQTALCCRRPWPSPDVVLAISLLMRVNLPAAHDVLQRSAAISGSTVEVGRVASHVRCRSVVSGRGVCRVVYAWIG